MLIKSVKMCAEAPILHISEAGAQIEQLEREIDDLVYDLYGLSGEDRAVVESKVI